MSKRQNSTALKFSLLLITTALILIFLAAACDDYSHNSIVNTPPANYVTLLVSKTFGDDGYDWGAAITTTPDNEYVITGSTTSKGYGPNTVYLARVGSSGDLAWFNWAGGWGDDNGHAVRIAPDGSIVVAGVTTSFDVVERTKIDPNSGKPLDDYSFYLMKATPDGVIMWEEGYGDPDYVEMGYSLALSSDAYYIAGHQFRSETEVDVYIVKANLDSDPSQDGDPIWQNTYGTSNIDRASSIITTSDGGIVVGGYTQPPASAKSDAYLLKINADGDQTWQRIHSSSEYSLKIYSITQTSDGGLVAACSGVPVSTTDSPGSLLYVIRMNADGTVLWQHAYAQSGINEPRTIIEDAQGAFLICGQYYAGHTALITKIDAAGAFLWSDAVGVAGFGMSMSRCEAGYVITGSTTYPDHQSLNDVMFLMVEEDPTNLE